MTGHQQRSTGRTGTGLHRMPAISPTTMRGPRRPIHLQIARLTLAGLAVGLIMGCQAENRVALAADPAGMAPKALTLDQPSDTPSAACKPLHTAAAALAPLSLKQTFADDFNAGSLSVSTWETHYPGLANIPDNRTLPTNSEQQIYVDKNFKGANIDPFVFKNGVLSIVVNKTPPENLSTFKKLPYTSGLITTRHSFEQTYGYFEIRARMPRGKALWPAFWMLRTQQGWPPEIDIFEVLNGNKPDEIYMTTHWKEGGVGKHQHTYCQIAVKDSDKVFHNYGVLWTQQRIVYYLDRKPIGEFATPAGLDHPMYLLANLAVQKGANDSTPMGASFDIDWIAAYDF
ncbi:MAG TPA: glycoside hydrolase family 16 protein [Dongiaceae bacterium]